MNKGLLLEQLKESMMTRFTKTGKGQVRVKQLILDV